MNISEVAACSLIAFAVVGLVVAEILSRRAANNKEGDEDA